jgi:hypothetical protein
MLTMQGGEAVFTKPISLVWQERLEIYLGIFYFTFNNFIKMDIIIEKLAELDVESRAQHEFWEAELVRDEEEQLDREVV